MKLAWKIFCVAYCIVMVTVGAGGFALVRVAAASMTDSRRDAVLTANAYAGKMFYALAEKSTSPLPRAKEIQSQIAGMVDGSRTDRLTVSTAQELSASAPAAFVALLADAQQGYAYVSRNGIPMLQAVCRIDFAGERYYVETLSDFSDVRAQKERLVGVYRWTVLLVALLSGTVLLGFSVYIARPLGRLSQAANRIAAGDYEKRIPLGRHGMGSEEIRKLSEDFNKMAGAVENNVNELRDEVEKRECFVANFTHELKTPMTSIIGYADMLRSYQLDEEERRKAANAVFREGKRLERLSMQLLDILVLKNAAPELRAVSAAVLFDSLEASLRFLSEKHGVTIETKGEPALIRAEPTLLQSLLMNLADNACKASPAGAAVSVTGIVDGAGYLFAVTDRGRGIPAAHLDKILEPFYMEDTSRSRSQGGAGLGLALCKRIADLHGAALTFDSREGAGTTVTLRLEIVAGPPARRKEAPV